MGIGTRVSLIACMVLSLTSAVRAIKGNAVFYSPPYTPSACYVGKDNGNMVAGVSDALWKNGRACGKRYRVRRIGGANAAPHPCKRGKSVVDKLVDYCKTGCRRIVNLSQDAFSAIADTDAGIVQVEFQEVRG